MSSVTIAAVQAASVLMNQEATLAKAVEVIAKAAARGSRIVVRYFTQTDMQDTDSVQNGREAPASYALGHACSPRNRPMA
jgi:predicted amidohydrolase